MRIWGDRVGAETVRADREGRPGQRGDGRDEHGGVFAMPCRTRSGALAERLTALLSDPATARAMADKGRAWVEREWSWDLTTARLRTIIG
jgi:glycosyltransferase involved in cell wall biosynthesis